MNLYGTQMPTGGERLGDYAPMDAAEDVAEPSLFSLSTGQRRAHFAFADLRRALESVVITSSPASRLRICLILCTARPGRSSENPEPITTICKNGRITSIPSLYVFPTDKGDIAGVHPCNRILARA